MDSITELSIILYSDTQKSNQARKSDDGEWSLNGIYMHS